MKSPEISTSVESTIVNLAGTWAREKVEQLNPITPSNLEKWEEDFTNLFNVYYTILFRAIILARELSQQNTIIKTKR